MHFAVLDNNMEQPARSFLFETPQTFLTCFDSADVPNILARMADYQRHGYWCVGSIAYEVAEAFAYNVKGSHKTGSSQQPLIEVGVFEDPRIITEPELFDFLAQQEEGSAKPGQIKNIQTNTTFDDYRLSMARIKQHLKVGDSYQVNYTLQQTFDVDGSVFDLFLALRDQQPTQYGALLNFPTQCILSRSPELFFEKRGRTLTVKPMKGTAPRASDPVADAKLVKSLQHDQKQVAENVMIVDLLRNDLGRLATTNSVEVPALFEVETYTTVHQMTSTVTCDLAEDQTLAEILMAVFPCGSITGAPKHRTCEIIADVEKSPRGVYTGAIGYVSPQNDMCFNVPIRTAAIQDSIGVFGLGSGVTYESDTLDEYEECLLKGQFLRVAHPTSHRVLDCFYADPAEGHRHQDVHLKRLHQSCQALGYPFDPGYIAAKLDRVLTDLTEPVKVRIEVSYDGAALVEAVPLVPFSGSQPQIYVSDTLIDSSDPIYQHKTTNRPIYDPEFKTYRQDYGAYDVVFFNENGHLTEGCHHNIVLKRGEHYVTPALDCGVLPGVGRQMFLDAHADIASEGYLTREDLAAADEILMISSIRGVVPVTLATL